MRVARLRPEIYSLAVLTLGSTLCILAGLSVFYLNQADYNQEWLLLAGAVVTVGMHDALRLDRLGLRFRLNDAFTFTLALFYGAFPAALTAAVSAILIGWQTKQKRWNLYLPPAAAALSITSPRRS